MTRRSGLPLALRPQGYVMSAVLGPSWLCRQRRSRYRAGDSRGTASTRLHRQRQHPRTLPAPAALRRRRPPAPAPPPGDPTRDACAPTFAPSPRSRHNGAAPSCLRGWRASKPTGDLRVRVAALDQGVDLGHHRAAEYACGDGSSGMSASIRSIQTLAPTFHMSAWSILPMRNRAHRLPTCTTLRISLPEATSS